MTSETSEKLNLDVSVYPEAPDSFEETETGKLILSDSDLQLPGNLSFSIDKFKSVQHKKIEDKHFLILTTTSDIEIYINIPGVNKLKYIEYVDTISNAIQNFGNKTEEDNRYAVYTKLDSTEVLPIYFYYRWFIDDCYFNIEFDVINLGKDNRIIKYVHFFTQFINPVGDVIGNDIFACIGPLSPNKKEVYKFDKYIRTATTSKVEKVIIIFMDDTYFEITDVKMLNLMSSSKLNNFHFNKNKALLDAFEHKNTEDIKILLNIGANINVALHAAAKSGDIDFVKTLIDKGANVNEKGDDGDTPLHAAARKGDIDIVKTLIEKGANVNEKDNNGNTPLHVAAATGHIDVVKTLIEKGANVNEKTEKGATPLHVAASIGHIDVVRTLIDKGAIVNEKAGKGYTQLHLAASNGHIDVVKTLIEKGANVNEKTEDGFTPLHLATINNQNDVVKTLIEKGANVNEKAEKGITPLYAAAIKGHIDVVKTLIEKGANVNEKAEKGQTPLHVAASNGHIDVVRTLIEKGANVNEKDENGHTPYHFVANSDIQKLIKGISANSDTTPINKPLSADSHVKKSVSEAAPKEDSLDKTKNVKKYVIIGIIVFIVLWIFIF